LPGTGTSLGQFYSWPRRHSKGSYIGLNSFDLQYHQFNLPYLYIQCFSFPSWLFAFPQSACSPLRFDSSNSLLLYYNFLFTIAALI
jgi:hypothetical protein